MNRSLWKFALVPALVFCLGPASAAEGGWKDTAEFSYVVTSGNSDSSTLGFKNTLSREWDASKVTFKAGGIRVETTTVSDNAVGTPTSFVVPENEETTAENYFVNGRYDRKITDRFFWYGGLGWDRNRFAGIDNRWIAEAGVGNIWRDDDVVKFKTNYAATFTDQEDVFPTPGLSDTFAGVRVSWDYWHKFGENTEYVNTLIVDENLDETDDFRVDMVNSLSVSMNKSLALKVSHQLLYDNAPAFEDYPLVDAAGNPVIDPGTGAQVRVARELDDVDTIFTVALVVNF